MAKVGRALSLPEVLWAPAWTSVVAPALAAPRALKARSSLQGAGGHPGRGFVLRQGQKPAFPAGKRDLLLAAAMFHDIGKMEELSVFPENDYTDAGQLLGHIVIGIEQIGARMREIPGFPKGLGNELKHCILAHHGELEYGSPKKPAIAEALALSFADNLDAKMETFREIFINVPENNLEWQGYNRLFETNVRRSGRE